MALEYFQFPYLSDNYGVLIHCPSSGESALVDAGDANAALTALKQKGWALNEIWITHHHWDHTQGLAEIKAATGAYVIGPAYDNASGAKIAGLDTRLSEGSTHRFAGQHVDILHTPGHTLDMINFHLPTERVVFTGDTLFTLGCGRIFEGTPDQMWASLRKLIALPDETVIYSAHEYSAANAAFALQIEPENVALQARAQAIREKRALGRGAVPSTLKEELETNPFLRAGKASIKVALGMEGASDAEVFAEIRRRKDRA